MIQRFGVVLVFAVLFSTGCATQQNVANNSTQNKLAPCVSAIPYIEAGDEVIMITTGTVPLYMQLKEKSCERVHKQGF